VIPIGSFFEGRTECVCMMESFEFRKKSALPPKPFNILAKHSEYNNTLNSERKLRNCEEQEILFDKWNLRPVYMDGSRIKREEKEIPNLYVDIEFGGGHRWRSREGRNRGGKRDRGGMFMQSQLQIWTSLLQRGEEGREDERKRIILGS
jgi:hypothetical protein